MKILFVLFVISLIPFARANAQENYRKTPADLFMNDCAEVFGDKEPSKDCRDDVEIDSPRQMAAPVNEVNSYSDSCRDHLAEDCQEKQAQTTK